MSEEEQLFTGFWSVLNRVPGLGDVRRDLSGLRWLLMDRRAPRIVAVGRAHSGRTTLMGALSEQREPEVGFACAWRATDGARGKLDWAELDLDAVDAADEFARLISDARPDLVMLVASPEDVEESLDGLTRAWTALTTQAAVREANLRVVSVLSKADLVVGADAELKLDLIRQRFATAIAVQKMPPIDPPQVVSVRTERGLRSLSESVLGALPDEARLEGARVFVQAEQGRRRVARELVQACSALSMTLALTPIPFADVTVLAPLQALMVSALAYMSGRAWSRKTVVEWLASLGVVGGLGLGLRWSARQMVKFFPGGGTVVSAGVAGAGTTAMGKSAIAYFMAKDRLAR